MMIEHAVLTDETGEKKLIVTEHRDRSQLLSIETDLKSVWQYCRYAVVM